MGLVHGRLVPEDIVTVSGLLKVGGIGLWHCAGDAAMEVWGGAARYVAPEAWSAQRLGPKADVFSAAVILAELACGGGGELWKQTGEVRELKDELSLGRSDIASELTAALESDPARRVDSPRTLLATLRAALGETLIDEEIDAPPQPANGTSTAIPGPTAEIAAIDLEIEASQETAHYIRKAPEIKPGDFPDSEVVQPPRPERRRLVTPPPMPVTPPPVTPPPADLREAGQGLPMPLVAAPSREFAIPPMQAMADASLPTTPFNRPVSIPPESHPLAPRKRSWLPYVAVAAAAAVGVALVAWVALNELFGDDSSEAAPAKTAQSTVVAPTPAPTPAPAPAPMPAPMPAPAPAPTRPETKPAAGAPVVVAPGPAVASACPASMVQVEAYCIDAHESPGAGRLPETGMTYAMADKACTDRGARLCEPKEWERACRGPKGWSFPYGTSHRRTKCNTDQGSKAEIGASGSFDCVSEEGVHDLSGNAAEWVADARPRGGSATDGTDGRCSRKRKPDRDGAHDDVGYRCCANAK